MELRDIEDINKGLTIKNNKQITTYEHLIQVDSRDCIGEQSLLNSRYFFENNGGRPEANGKIVKTSGIFSSPIKIGITITDSNLLKNGDFVKIEGVQGNTKANGSWKIQNVLIPDPNPDYISSFEINSLSNGNYTGSGFWIREADSGYPEVSNTDCLIVKNEIMINLLHKRLKALRSFSLSWAAIPRDIIPIEIYYTDLFEKLNYIEEITFIQQSEKTTKKEIIGFYSTPLSVMRNYYGTLCIPNQITPPPLNLWNPPLSEQPLPYSYQTVPTYKSSNFTIQSFNVYIICSGYGVYDLKDWTGLNRIETELARKTLLMAIIQPQSIYDFDIIDLILNCTTTSNDIYPFGYGNFQRFIPGPGLQLNYQPGVSDGANPSGPPSVDYPVIFPNFLGNVWGPYDSPGDRFQKFGLRDTVQDLFLNGDLNNLLGKPIIKPEIIRENIMSDSTYGINFDAFESVNFSNFKFTTNYNIINAMKISPNGFGALNVKALGTSTYYNSRYQLSGGIGPSTLGLNGAWSLFGTNNTIPNLADPNAVGPLLINGTTPSSAQGNNPNNYSDQSSTINHRASWYTNNSFIQQLENYIRYVLTQISDTNLIIHAFQVSRDYRVQSTNSNAGDSIFNVPIRLSLGTSNGNFEYIEGIYGLFSNSVYWERRFLAPKASLNNLTLRFTTYDGTPIPLERMLQLKNSNSYNPKLINKTKRAISLIFKAECYQYVNVGLNIPEQVQKILGDEERTDEEEFMIRAMNYEDYQ